MFFGPVFFRRFIESFSSFFSCLIFLPLDFLPFRL